MNMEFYVMRQRVFSLVLSGLSLAGIAGCHRQAPPSALPVAVRVAVLKAEPVSSDTRFSATVRERQRLELSFKVPGTVESLLQVAGLDGRMRDVHEGDVVPADAEHPLARLDASDYQRRVDTAREKLAQARAKQRAAQAAVTMAQATYVRLESLRATGAVAQQSFDDATGRRDGAEADLEATRREVGAAEVALQQAEDDLRNCSLVSPIPGATVSHKLIESNERVPAGKPVFEVMDLSQVRVAFGVPDTMVGQFQTGQGVTVTAEAFRGTRYAGRVSKILPAADLKTRSFEVEVTIDEPKELRPGMVVTIVVGEQRQVVLVPMTAVQHGEGDEGFTLFTVVTEDGRQVARRRRVQLGGVYDNRIQVIDADGRSEVRCGDTVVVTGAFRLTDGQEVRVLDTADDVLRVEF